MSLYFKFHTIYFWLLNEYQWWDQATIYHIIRQLSHRLRKTLPQDYDYELLNPSKTKIPVTIVKAQMPSNPNQKSRTRDNKSSRWLALNSVMSPEWLRVTSYIIQMTKNIEHMSSGRLTQTPLPWLLSTPYIAVIILIVRALLCFTIVK